MMIQAVLGNPHHPEYGVATIPFPIPHDQYAHCMELLEALEIGDAVKADCKVEKIDSFYTVLKRTEMLTVNVEELNYLAKRLDSFDTGEAAQFQAMAHKLELFELKDLINLTFCCQQAMEKLGAAVMLAEPKSAAQIKNLAESLDLFDFAPGAHTPEEYGKYMIQQSGRFEYDENLDAFYDYEKYGTEHMNAEDGMFTDRGYIAYKGYYSMEEVMNGSQSSRMEMGGMM